MGENIRVLTPKIKPGETDKLINEKGEIKVRRKERGSYAGKK